MHVHIYIQSTYGVHPRLPRFASPPPRSRHDCHPSRVNARAAARHLVRKSKRSLDYVNHALRSPPQKGTDRLTSRRRVADLVKALSPLVEQAVALPRAEPLSRLGSNSSQNRFFPPLALLLLFARVGTTRNHPARETTHGCGLVKEERAQRERLAWTSKKNG